MLRQTTLSSLVGQALPSPEADALAREVLRAMFLSKLQTVTGAVLIGCVVLGLGLFRNSRPAW